MALPEVVSLKLFACLSSLSGKDVLNPIDDHGPTKAQFCSLNQKIQLANQRANAHVPGRQFSSFL